MTYKVWDPEAYSDGPLQIGFQGFVPNSTVGFMTAVEAVGVPVVDELNSGNNTGVKQGTGCLDPEYRRSSSYDSFYKQARDRPNLDVLHSAPVQSLIFDEASMEEGGTPRVTGVNFRDEPSSLYYQISARKEVIVSLGAFHTPQFLMVSGIGPEEELSRFGINPVVVNENVGQHLNDHNVFSIMALATEDADSAQKRNSDVELLIAAQEQYYSGNGGTYTSPSGITNGFQQLTNETLIEIGAEEVVNQGYVNRAHVEFLFENIFYPGGPTPYYIPSGDENYISVTASSLIALSRGNVTLRGTSMQDIPVINPNYFADPTDRAIAINSFRDLRKILAHPALAQYTMGPNSGEVSPGVENVPDDDEDAIWEYIQENTIPNWHASGTAQMLPLEDGGVVDARLKVYGVEGLRVVDCSIIPVLPDVNIAGPVYMIAEKGSDLIREDWGF
jgi:choline dehydrogenase